MNIVTTVWYVYVLISMVFIILVQDEPWSRFFIIKASSRVQMQKQQLDPGEAADESVNLI